MIANDREEILKKAKPILFNTDMVRAILDGRKTVTRRVLFPNKDLREFRSDKSPNGWWLKGRVYKDWDNLMHDLQEGNSAAELSGTTKYVSQP